MSGIMNMFVATKTTIATAVDAFFNSVSLLLNTSSTNGAQNNTFLDSSTNNFTVTRNGNTTQGTFTPFSQTGWSNYFNGSSTISFGSSSALNILAYDTFECWVNMPVIGTNDLIAGKDGNFWMGYNFTGIGGASNKFVFSIWNGSAWQAVSSTTTPVVGTWYHLLGVKDNTTMRFYVNGVQENTSTFSGSPVTTGTFYVASNNNVENFEGYISNLRLITGASNTVFPYSGLTTGASFTPPTSALTAVSGTALLTCQSNRFVDNSSNNFSATITSIPSVQAFSPFLPTAAYDTAVVGGSGYFDGSGDYLTGPSNAAFSFGTGDFTAETWVYFTSLPVIDQALFDFRNGVDATSFVMGVYSNNIPFIANSSGGILNGSFTFYPNTWYHIAYTRNGTSLNIWVNGVNAGTTTNSTNLTGTNCKIGANVSGGDNVKAYLSNVRVVKGTAVYTAAFTPPTSLLTAISGTSLLLNYTNAGIYDSASKNVLETVGNAQVSTTQAKWGTTAMYFDGTGDYLAIPSGYNLGFGTGDFTIEGWLYLSATSSYSTIMSNRPNGSDTTTGRWSVAVRSSAFEFYANGSQIISAGTVSTSTWTHFAVTRASGSLRLFLGGTQVGSTTSFTTDLSSLATWVGANGAGTEAINAYIDDLRVTKGYARYTSNFTPATEAFPVQ